MKSAWENLETLREGDLLTVHDVSAIVPGYGAPTCSRTVYRWIVDGVGGIRLPARRLGRVYLIHRADLAAFIAAIAAGKPDEATSDDAGAFEREASCV